MEDYAKSIFSAFLEIDNICCYKTLKLKTDETIEVFEGNQDNNSNKDILNYNKEEGFKQVFISEDKYFSPDDISEMNDKYGFNIAYSSVMNKYIHGIFENISVKLHKQFSNSSFEYLQQLYQFRKIEEKMIQIYFEQNSCEKEMDFEQIAQNVYDIEFSDKIALYILETPIIQFITKNNKGDFENAIKDIFNSEIDNLKGAISNAFISKSKYFKVKIKMYENKNLCKVFIYAFIRSVMYNTIMGILRYNDNSKRDIIVLLKKYKKSLQDIVDYHFIKPECINTEKITQWVEFVEVGAGSVQRVMLFILSDVLGIDMHLKGNRILLNAFDIKYKSIQKFDKEIKNLMKTETQKKITRKTSPELVK